MHRSTWSDKVHLLPKDLSINSVALSSIHNLQALNRSKTYISVVDLDFYFIPNLDLFLSHDYFAGL